MKMLTVYDIFSVFDIFASYLNWQHVHYSGLCVQFSLVAQSGLCVDLNLFT